LAAGLYPDPLGKFTALPSPPSWTSRRETGRERKRGKGEGRKGREWGTWGGEG